MAFTAILPLCKTFLNTTPTLGSGFYWGHQNPHLSQQLAGLHSAVLGTTITESNQAKGKV